MRLDARRRAGPGFTLVEAMITILIVAAASIGATQMAIFVRTQNDLEQERARAHQIVSEEMEWVRHTLYTHLRTGGTVVIWDNGTPENPDDNTEGLLEIIVRDPAGNLVTHPSGQDVALTVEVTLTWNPRGRLGARTFRETVMTRTAP